MTAAPGLDENCTATLLNRTVQVNPDGTFAIGNVPVPNTIGAIRVRVICETPDGVVHGTSSFVSDQPNGNTLIPEIVFGVEDPIPVDLFITSPTAVLTPSANGAQLVTTGVLNDGLEIDLTLSDTGTFYLSSNPAIATVSVDGFVLAASSGTVLIASIEDPTVIETILTSPSLGPTFAGTRFRWRSRENG